MQSKYMTRCRFSDRCAVERNATVCNLTHCERPRGPCKMFDGPNQWFGGTKMPQPINARRGVSRNGPFQRRKASRAQLRRSRPLEA
uniref:Uncharacterized protein n=1 Tax=Zea mays TaxID=4577 RepID=C4J2Y0_MAIZE|nr:unknown [Zea mays]